MQSQLQPNYSTNQLNLTQRRPPYTIVTYNQHNYRILSKQYQSGITMLNIWAVFWSLIFLIALTLTVIDFLDINRLFVLISGCISSVIFTVAVFLNRNQLKTLILYSSINLSVFIIILTIIALLYQPWMLIPVTAYSLLMKKKGHVFAKSIFLIQILLLALKVDNKINATWVEILFGLVILIFLTLVCFLFVGIYLLYTYCNKSQRVQCQYKFQGILFLFLSLFSFISCFILPLVKVYLNYPTWIFALSFSIMYLLMPIYIYMKKKQIVIIFCTLNEVKAFNQIIQIQKIANQLDLENTQTTSKVTRSKSYCYQLSSNWFSFEPRPPIQINYENIQNPQQKNEIPQCLICLQQKAQLIWMPCGHLIVCGHCCQFMFQKKNINCVLCKKVPQQLFLIDNRIKKKQQIQQIKDKVSQSKKQNELNNKLLSVQKTLEQPKNQSMKQIIQMEIEIQLSQQQNNHQKQQKYHSQKENNKKELQKRNNKVTIEQQTRSVRKNNLFQILQGFNVKVI